MWMGMMFQHTATRRWLVINSRGVRLNTKFQHTATRRWLGKSLPS